MLVRLTANYCYRMQYFTGEIWSSKETNSLGKQPQRRADYEVCSLTVRDKKKNTNCLQTCCLNRPGLTKCTYFPIIPADREYQTDLKALLRKCFLKAKLDWRWKLIRSGKKVSFSRVLCGTVVYGCITRAGCHLPFARLQFWSYI